MNSGGATIGDAVDSQGTVTVSGRDANGNASTWNSGNIYAGYNGTGTLNIADGASVASSGPAGGSAAVYIGYNAGSIGAMTVSSTTGNVSSLTVTGSIDVGERGTGTMTVAKGGLVSVRDDIHIGLLSGSGGTLHLNGDVTGRGVLETGSVIKGAGTASLDLNGGILRATRDESNFLNGFGALTLGTGGAWFDSNGHVISISTAFSGTSGFTKQGLGTLTLTGANGYGGGTTITAGTLQVGSGGTVGSITGNVADNGMLAFNHNDFVTFTGTISGTGGVRQMGTGTLELTAANTYAGGTTITGGGMLRITSDANLGDASGGITFNNGTLQSLNPITANRSLNFAGNGTLFVDTTFNSSSSLTVTGNVTGAGTLTKTGLGRLTFTGDVTNTGGITASQGQLQLGDGGTTGSIAGDIVLSSGSGLTFNRSDNYSYGGSLSGGGSIAVHSGTLSLTGTSNFSGSATVDRAAELRVAAGGSFTTTSTVSTSQSTLTVSGPGASLTAQRVSAVAGSGNDSTINVTNGGLIRATVGLNAMQLRLLTGMGSANLNISGAGSKVDLSGSGGLSTGSTAGSTSIVTISDGGTLLTGMLSALGSNTGNTVASTYTVTGAGSNWTGTGTVLVRTGHFQVLNDGDVSFGTVQIGVSQSADLLVSGAGSTFTTAQDVQIGTTNSGTGMVTITDGGRVSTGTGLKIGTDNSGNTGIVNIGGGEGGAAAAAGFVDGAVIFGPGVGRLNFNHTNSAYSFASGMSGNGTINQVAGVTSLTGDSSAFTGTTKVSGGVLRVNGTLGDATSVTNVLTGGTLGGSGTIGGNVSVADGGALAPGNSPGTLTINGNLALAGGSALNFEFGQAGASGGALNDLIHVGGNLTLDGMINVAVSPGGSFGGGLYRVFDYTGTLTDNGLVLGTLPAGSDVFVQTAISHQVNLVNIAGLDLSFWDGAAGPKFNGLIGGGNGSWHLGIDDNWTETTGAINAAYKPGSFAIFAGTPGTVSVDNGNGAVTASGMQFATGGYVITGGPLTLTGTQATIRVGDGTAAGAGYTATIDASLTGTAQLVKTDQGTLVLGGVNTYTGGTKISGGMLRISSDANMGAAAGGLDLDGGTLNTTADITSARVVHLGNTGAFLTNGGTTLTLSGAISGTGGFTKSGAGTLALSGTGSYTGGATVSAGTLLINGNFAATTGLTSVASGATLGGTGTLGGNVTLGDGATLSPGSGGAGKLTIGGNLSLASGSRLAFEFGQAYTAGGALNDLVTVGGNLTLDGTIDVTVPLAGAFDVGVYRVFNYGGTLTNNGLTLGAMPTGSRMAVQTSIAGQVNLVNTAGLTLNFWDGAAGAKNNSAVNGGNGTWQNGAGNDNWTIASGQVNAAYSDGAFAVFGGAAGTVSIDNSLGAATASGLQFISNGYTLQGNTLTLSGPQATIRVGDGSAAGAGYTANAALGGNTQLIKTDAGTLVLGGANSYTGGTAISGGTLQISADANLGAASGSVTLDGGTLATTADLTSGRNIVLTGTGTIATADTTTFTWNGTLSGGNVLAKTGAGTLLLTGNNSGYAGASAVSAGVLAVTGTLGGGADGRQRWPAGRHRPRRRYHQYRRRRAGPRRLRRLSHCRQL